MRVVVADTGPLHYLVLIDAIDLLPFLFTTVVISSEVHAELSDAGAPALVRAWAAALPSWASVCGASPSPDDPAMMALDDGERAAIALAEVMRPELLLIDDRAGVAVAEARGLAVTGTLGVLTRAARRGAIDLADKFASLQETNFHVRSALLERLLAEDRALRGI